MAQLSPKISNAIFSARVDDEREPLEIPYNIALEDFRAFLLTHIEPRDPNLTIEPNASGDKTVHYFEVAGHHSGNMNGRYVFYPDGCPAGWVQDMSKHTDPIKYRMDLAEYRRKYGPITSVRSNTKKKNSARATTSATNTTPVPSTPIPDITSDLATMTPATASNSYLASKHVNPVQGLLECNGYLIVPYFDEKGTAKAYQRIKPGYKRTAKGTSLTNAFFVIGGPNGRLPEFPPIGQIQICEGIATGLTLHAASEAILTIVTGGISNLPNVVQIIKNWTQNIKDIYVMADDDYKLNPKENKGFDTAIKAVRACGLPDHCVCLPPFDHEADAGLTDWNDYAVKYGLDATRAAILDRVIKKVELDNAASATMPTEIPVTQDIPAASLAMPQSPATTLPTQASADNTQGQQHVVQVSGNQSLEQLKSAIKTITLQATSSLDTNQAAPELEYIANLFPRGYYSLLAAAPGVGKTFLLERIAVDLSLGGKVLDGFGYTQKPLTTLIMSGEAGTGLLIRRARMMEWKANSNYIKVFDSKKTAKILGGVNLDKHEGRLVLKSLLEELRPDIVFIDSLTSFFSGSFNRQEDVVPLIMMCAEFAETYNCAIVLVHHIRKRMVKERDTPLDLDDIVGTGALARNCAVAIGIERVPSIDPTQNIKLVKCLKDWERKHPRPFTFEIKDGFYDHKEMCINLDVDDETAYPVLTKTGQIDKKAMQKTGLFEQLRLVLDVTQPFLKKEIKEKLKAAGHNYSDTGLVRGLEQLIKRKLIFSKGQQRYAVYFFTDYYEGPDFNNKEMCKALHDGKQLEEVYKLADETSTKEVVEKCEGENLTLNMDGQEKRDNEIEPET